MGVKAAVWAEAGSLLEKWAPLIIEMSGVLLRTQIPNIQHELLYHILPIPVVRNIQEIFLHTALGQWYLGEYESVSHSVGGMKSEDKNFNRSRNLRSEVTIGEQKNNPPGNSNLPPCKNP